MEVEEDMFACVGHCLVCCFLLPMIIRLGFIWFYGGGAVINVRILASIANGKCYGMMN